MRNLLIVLAIAFGMGLSTPPMAAPSPQCVTQETVIEDMAAATGLQGLALTPEQVDSFKREWVKDGSRPLPDFVTGIVVANPDTLPEGMNVVPFIGFTEDGCAITRVGRVPLAELRRTISSIY